MKGQRESVNLEDAIQPEVCDPVEHLEPAGRDEIAAHRNEHKHLAGKHAEKIEEKVASQVALRRHVGMGHRDVHI